MFEIKEGSINEKYPLTNKISQLKQLNANLINNKNAFNSTLEDSETNKSKSVLTGANISILDEIEDAASTKDSDANSLYSLNDQLFSRLFPNNDRKMSVVSLISCKELDYTENGHSKQTVKEQSLYYKVLLQGLDSND